MKTVKLGSNTKWIIRPEFKEAVGSMLASAFGAKVVAEPTPAMVVYEMPSGDRVGVEMDADALTAEQAKKGAWLEVVASDASAVIAALDGQGVARVPYHDTSHVYFQAPGGPVFRVSAAT